MYILLKLENSFLRKYPIPTVPNAKPEAGRKRVLIATLIVKAKI
jgi:hypothetical protein